MLNLTPQQRRVICGLFLLLLFGWGVKAWRQAHPPVRTPVAGVAKH